MASISTDSAGNRRILFCLPDQTRKQIRLGRVPQGEVELLKRRIEHLIEAAHYGSLLPRDVARWAAKLTGPLADRLANAGLVPKRQRATLGDFIDAYIQGRTDVKLRTVWKYETTKQYLLDFFGTDKPIRAITPGDADDWRLSLAEKRKHSENTLRKHTAIAKQFFHVAKRKRLIEENPFAGLKSAVQANPSRFYFVTRQETQQVLEACPDSQWRLLFALSRFGGLRCPSEHLGLRWGDVDWERGRLTVHSPKTAHHPGGESRTVPLFPELRPHLEAAFDEAEPGTEHVITRYRDSNQNLRTQLLRIIQRAGLEPWPKIFQNLRSSRETELAQQFPMHVVCSWIGNSEPVAAKHYLQVTDAHYEQAVGEAAQKAAQYSPEKACKGQKQETQNPGFAGVCGPLQYCTNGQVAAVGVEPTTRGL